MKAKLVLLLCTALLIPLTGGRRASRAEREVPTLKGGTPMAAREPEVLTTSHSPGWHSTSASWYDGRPARCYDSAGGHPFPEGHLFFAAHRTLPCLTPIEIEGPRGRALTLIVDRGPYVRGRDLDLSPAAFEAAVGPLSSGVGTLRYREVCGE